MLQLYQTCTEFEQCYNDELDIVLFINGFDHMTDEKFNNILNPPTVALSSYNVRLFLKVPLICM